MFGVPMNERGRRVAETFAVLKAAFSGEPFEYRGRTVHITPTPFRPGGPSISLGGSSNVTATRITDADQTNVIAFARNTTQVLNIVTGGGAVSNGKAVSPAVGVFFPNGLNAGPNGFK